jgi:DNA-directed RNA polymerase subunit A'
MIEQSRTGDLELFPGKTIEETLEIRILERLNKLRNRIGDIVAEVSTKETGTLTMMKSGARGKNINLAQMAACVGQQALSGGRVNFGYKDRTLSCFNRNDRGPEAHGFIKSGFKDGLKPHEFFFMAMTGRDSLMDTALRTPKSGYLYRRLANAMQDLRTDTSQAVRDATGNIVQFSYGEDGMDVSKTEGGTVNVAKIINEVMDKE